MCFWKVTEQNASRFRLRDVHILVARPFGLDLCVGRLSFCIMARFLAFYSRHVTLRTVDLRSRTDYII